MKMTLIDLDSELRKVLQYEVLELNRRIERTLLRLVTPNATYSFNMRSFRTFRELENLSVLSWYLEEGPGILLRLDLEKKVKQFSSLTKRCKLALLLNSKEDCLEVLNREMSERDFFGNFLKNFLEDCRRLKFSGRVQLAALRKIRRRGYQDKGSCKPQSSWLPSFDWSLTELQNFKEEQEEIFQKSSNSISKFGCLGVRLPLLEMDEDQRILLTRQGFKF